MANAASFLGYIEGTFQAVTRLATNLCANLVGPGVGKDAGPIPLLAAACRLSCRFSSAAVWFKEGLGCILLVLAATGLLYPALQVILKTPVHVLTDIFVPSPA